VPTKPKPSSAQRTKDNRSRYNRARGNSSGYSGKAWFELRQAVLERDGYRCQSCRCFVGMTPGDGHVDHIIPRGQRGSTEEMSNLRVLCRRCHGQRTRADSRVGG
jgi:5-methylcytosine-specific restriction protein A